MRPIRAIGKANHVYESNLISLEYNDLFASFLVYITSCVVFYTY